LRLISAPRLHRTFARFIGPSEFFLQLRSGLEDFMTDLELRKGTRFLSKEKLKVSQPAASDSAAAASLLKRPFKHAILVNSFGSGAPNGRHLGSYGYSYDFVQEAFAPLLQQLGELQVISQPESRLEHKIRSMRQRQLAPISLQFLPFQDIHATRSAPLIVYLFWEFPDVPDRELGDNPKFDWVRLSKYASVIMTASSATAEAFSRAGIRTPVRVVPVPISDELFKMPLADPANETPVSFRALTIVNNLPKPAACPWGTWWNHGQPPLFSRRIQAWQLAKQFYLNRLQPHAPAWLDRKLAQAVRHLRGRADSSHAQPPPSAGDPIQTYLNQWSKPVTSLKGVVYTMIFNPYDARKNWPDLLSAFVLAHREHEDATLALKLVAGPPDAVQAMEGIRLAHNSMNEIPHRCRIVVIADYLKPHQMAELTRATTYYVNSTRAEGACLPLQEMMAAGRPGLSPVHSAMRDYFSSEVGFVIHSSPEPTHWPKDPWRRLLTSWHRLDWQSLHDQFVESYRIAKTPGAYAALAGKARKVIAARATSEYLLPLLQEALELAQARYAASQFGRKTG
jgi:hypothetical protein